MSINEINSLEDPLDEAERVAIKSYGSVSDIESLPSASNTVLRFRVGDQWKILKLAATQSQHLARNFVAAQLLMRHGIPTLEIEHADLNGSFIGKPYIIMRSAGDTNLWAFFSSQDDVQTALGWQMGELFARIHAIDLSDAPTEINAHLFPKEAESWLFDPDRVFAQATETGLFDTQKLALLKTSVNPFVRPEGNSMVHKDFHAGQCIVANGKISAIVDWDGAGADDSLIDYAKTDVYMNDAPPLFAQAYRQAYHANRPLPDDYEERYLSMLTLQFLRLIAPGAPKSEKHSAYFDKLVAIAARRA